MKPADSFELKDLNRNNLKKSNSTTSSTVRSGSSFKLRSSESRGPTGFLIAVTCTCALTALHFGYAISSIDGPSKVFLTCSSPSPSITFGCFGVSQRAWGLVGTSLNVGGWIGGSFAPNLINKCGSLKRAILFLNLPLTIAYLLTSLAVNLPMLILGRCLLGFAAGASGMLVTLYLSSVTPLQFRGIFTNLFQLFLCSGVFLASFISFAADLSEHPWHWRLSFAFGLLIVASQLILAKIFNLLPEIPRDLRSTEAAEVLRNKLGIVHEAPADDCKNSDSSIPEIVSVPQGTLWELITFRIPSARKSLALGIALHVGQQISGVNAIFYYSNLIVGQFAWTPVLLAFINLLMTVVAIWLLDLSGRRPVALFSVAGSALTLIGLSASFLIFPPAASLFLVSFVICFAVGLGPVPWMLTSEIFPTTWPLTPTAISICVSANWITNIIVAGIFPSLIQIIDKQWVFLAFGLSCSLLFIYLKQYLPETKNRQPNFI